MMLFSCLWRTRHADDARARRRPRGEGSSLHRHHREIRSGPGSAQSADRARKRPTPGKTGRQRTWIEGPAPPPGDPDVILVDTSVWLDHLRAGDKTLAGLLHSGTVLAHPFVIGDLALGNLRHRRLR